MTTSALGAALSGLRVAQRSLDLVSNNIANAETEGYTRKTLPTEHILADGIGVGVRYGSVQRFVNQAILRDFRAQVSVESYLSKREPYLARIQSFHGSAEQESNIASRIGNLNNALVELSASPESTILQSTVVTKAQDVANNINRFSEFLLEQRNLVQREISLTVDDVNQQLEMIADLNKRIKSAKNTDQTTAAFEDQRDNAIKVLSEKIAITYFETSDGSIVVQTPQGQVLADEHARPIKFNEERIGYQSAYPDNLSGVILADNTIGEVDLASLNIGGELGALIDLRDETLPTYQAQLDELAHKMALRFDAQNLRMFTDSTGVIPPDVPENYAGFAAEMRVNQFILDDSSLVQSGTSGPTPDPGSNAIISNIVDYTFGPFSDASNTPHPPFRIENIGPNNAINLDLSFENISIEEFARGMISVQAEEHQANVLSLEIEESFTNDIQKRLLDTSAVDTDEELSNMIELQQAYAAAAQVITTLEELFNELLSAV